MGEYKSPPQTEIQRVKGYKPMKGGLFHKSMGYVKGCNMKDGILYGSELEMPVYLSTEWNKIKGVRNYHGDGDHVFEYESEIMTSVPELAEFTRNGLKHLADSGGAIHSYYPRSKDIKCYCDRCMENGGIDWSRERDYLRQSCSNHIQISPHDFRTYNNMFWLTQAFQAFFKNSPYTIDDKVYLSRRHDVRANEWCKSEMLKEEGYYDHLHNAVKHRALTPNDCGTIEFRRNDLSKSPQTVIFIAQIGMIARYVPDFLTSFAITKGETRNLKTLDEYKNADMSKMVAVAEYLERKYLPNERFYNYYTGQFETFTLMVANMIEQEVAWFEEFGQLAKSKRNPYYHWSKLLMPHMARELPMNVDDPFIENLCTLEEMIDSEYMMRRRMTRFTKIGGIQCVE